MTMPHLMNCSHSDTGWCVDCSFDGISIRRTGRVYSIASSEFRVVYPDGTEGAVWSPAWNEMSPEEEELSARKYAAKLYSEGKRKQGAVA